MAGRRDYYFRQKVSESELDEGFTLLEQALWDYATDLDADGIVTGLAVAQQIVPNMTVQVAAGAAYDAQGRRVAVPTIQTVNVATDYNGVSTAVAAPGNERYVGVYAGFVRTLADPRLDGNGLTVYFSRTEGFELRVVMGAESAIGTAVRPALDPARVLLADMRLVQGQVSVLTANIDVTRRQDALVAAGSPRSIRRGTVKGALEDVVAFYNNHVLGTADKHPATAVDYAGGPTWADGASNPAGSVEATLDSVITALRGATGDAKIGTSTPKTVEGKHTATVAGASLSAQLLALVGLVANLPNRIVAQGGDGLPGGGTVVGTGFTDVDDTFLITNIKDGDVLEYAATHELNNLGANIGLVQARLLFGVVELGTVTTDMLTHGSMTVVTRVAFTGADVGSRLFRHQVAAPTTGAGGNTTSILTGWTYRHIRP